MKLTKDEVEILLQVYNNLDIWITDDHQYEMDEHMKEEGPENYNERAWSLYSKLTDWKEST